MSTRVTPWSSSACRRRGRLRAGLALSTLTLRMGAGLALSTLTLRMGAGLALSTLTLRMGAGLALSTLTLRMGAGLALSTLTLRMGAGLALSALTLTAAGCGTTLMPQSRGDVIRRIVASTVQLRSDRGDGIRRAASGVVIGTDPETRRAWIVTVRHFLSPSRPQEIFVQHPEHTTAMPATVFALSAADLDIDLAILEVEDFGLVPARLKEAANLGDDVLIAAFPWGQRLTLVRGIVSQIASADEAAPLVGGARMVDATVSYGASGGGVFDARSGALVGIVETYRTTRIAIPELKDRVLEVPVPGETVLVPASVIQRFVLDFGLGRRLAR